MKLLKIVRKKRLSEVISESGLLNSALVYAALGWRIIPIVPGKKKPPLIDDWPNVGTTDAAQIRQWWKENPDANVGVVTGVGSDLLVLDVDLHDADGFAALKALTDKFGPMPETLVAETPTGGKHYFFASTRKFKSGTAVLGPGIDIRAEKGYVVLAPSVAQGGRYAWAK